MRPETKRACATTILILLVFTAAGCEHDFYLSENEARAYQSVLATQTSANLHFDNLQGRTLNLQFDNSTGTPRVISSNLVDEMRRTELLQLESGASAVSLDRLRTELETQINKWVAGKLQLYTGENNSGAKLTELSSASIAFLNNPTFTYNSNTQSIAFDWRVTLTLNGTIEVDAVGWLLNLFVNVNGTYPLTVVINDMRLQGDASIVSPFADAGRISLRFTPHIAGTIDVAGNGSSVPSQVIDGTRNLLGRNLASPVNETFTQRYDYFALTRLALNSAGRLDVTYRPRPDHVGPNSTDPRLHIVARALDGKYYHSRKTNGGWGTFTAVPFPSSWPQAALSQDPALFHSGGDQLELAGVNANNALVYGHWRDEEWGDWTLFTPGQWTSPSIGYRGTPAIVASAPGQAEIFAKDGNGNFWHLRRVNGLWVQPYLVPLSGYPTVPAPYRDPVALHVGNKIALIFINGQSKPTAIAFDLETGLWGQPTVLTQTTTNYAPAAVASGDKRVDLVYVATNGTPYHLVLNVTATNFVPAVGTSGISTSGAATALATTFNSAPVLTASGYQQLELIGRGTDNRLRHNHYVNAPGQIIAPGRVINPGWQTWSTGMKQNLFGTRETTDGRVSEFALAATRSGRTELVARAFTAYGYLAHRLFHDNYESDRYDSAPAKTIHWRGLEVTGASSFLGRPALAAVDRNFEVSNVGVGGSAPPNAHLAPLGEANGTSFTIGLSPRFSLNNPINPILLSSGPGLTDQIVLGSDGKPYHVRNFTPGARSQIALNLPTGVALTKMAAATHGNGLLELVALGNNGKLYHWRYRNLTWTGPTLLPGTNTVLSAPALLHVGAGQLELLAVDYDYSLRRWSFFGNVWMSPIVVPGNFRIKHELFGSTSASSWGDGTVDVVVVNKDTEELLHRRIGPGNEACMSIPPPPCPLPRTFANLGGRVWEDPVLTAFSPTRLNVLTMQGLRWFSIWASKHPNQFVTVPAPRDPRLLWSSFEYIGGDEMIVGSAANSGRKNFAALAIRDGRLYINRNQDGRWTGFQPVVGQAPTTIMRIPIIPPALAAHGG